MSSEMKAIITQMFKDEQLYNILNYLRNCSYFNDNQDCFDNCKYNEKIITAFIEIIESTAKEYNQESYIFNGYNGAYLFFKLNIKYLNHQQKY